MAEAPIGEVHGELGAGGQADPAAPLRYLGDRRLLERHPVALLSSTRTPPDLVLPTLDVVREEAFSGTVFVGGFQSPIERDCLEILLLIGAPVVVCPARAIEAMRLPIEWQRRVERGEMLIVSEIHGSGCQRPTAALADRRNRTVVTCAGKVLIPAGAPGSRTYAAALRAIERGLGVYTFHHPANRDLVILGARPLRIRRTRCPGAAGIQGRVRRD
ncbi:MAG TPA: hypothetical protein VMN39_07745 [Longimicrobiaceae bacterium]|nr:hypothetical protein [Longimicrobiaceae bacterium]